MEAKERTIEAVRAEVRAGLARYGSIDEWPCLAMTDDDKARAYREQPAPEKRK